MKSTRSGRGRRFVLPRALGYGGAVLLVAAAVAVLLMPLLGDDRAGTGVQADGRTGTGSPAAGNGVVPQTPATGSGNGPADPARQSRNGGGQAPTGQGGDGGGEMPLPDFGDGAGTPCQEGLGTAQYAGDALQVTVQVSGTAIAEVEVHLRGQSSMKKNGKLSGGKPRTFSFRGVPVSRIERIELKTFGSMVPQTCDLVLT